MKHSFSARSVRQAGISYLGGALTVDDEAKAVEVARTEGRVRKRTVTMARLKIGDARARLVNGELRLGDVGVQLASLAEAEEALSLILGPRRSEAMARIAEAANGFLSARARAVSALAELRERPREAMFRMQEGSKEGAEDFLAESESNWRSETEDAFDSLTAETDPKKSGLDASGVNKVQAAVYAIAAIQDSLTSKDQKALGDALGLLSEVSKEKSPAPDAVAGWDAAKATDELAPRAFAKINITGADWLQ